MEETSDLTAEKYEKMMLNLKQQVKVSAETQQVVEKWANGHKCICNVYHLEW